MHGTKERLDWFSFESYGRACTDSMVCDCLFNLEVATAFEGISNAPTEL
jgi:hypothetical protein